MIATSPRMVALFIAAIGAAATVIAIDTATRLRKPPQVRVRALSADRLPPGIPSSFQIDDAATVAVVARFDSLRNPCVESAAVLSAANRNDPEIRARLVEAFSGWERIVGKETDLLVAPDGTTVTIPSLGGTNAIDRFAASLAPARVIAIVYRPRSC